MKKYLRRSYCGKGMAESLNDESNDEEEDDCTICKICKIPWIEVTEKCGDWFQCDINDKYICPKSVMKRDIFPQMMMFCSIYIGS